MFRNIGPASGMVEGVKCTLATLTTQRNGPNLHTLIHSAVVLRRDKGAGASHSGFSERKQGVEVGLPKRSGSLSIKFPTLRFRAKIMLGFTVTLAISAASMGIAYMGFERVSSGVDVYRRSVREADLARDIDRELISYRSLARYFVATGKEEDGKAALAAETGLKDAITSSMKATTNPTRLEQIVKLEREFRTFTKIFADILKVKDESARIAQNQLTRSGMSLHYKVDDLASNADESEQAVISLGA